MVVLTSWLLKGRETPTEPVKINLIALSLLVLGVGSLQIMLDKGKDLDWFNSTTIIVLAIIAVIAIIYWSSGKQRTITRLLILACSVREILLLVFYVSPVPI
ncbi:putative multidrug efflux system [Klebsiella pneumoniae]|uniref:Putative multidrug efflux system n=1 Tax=Klebsiella pneumoniae TaxID=573 RepID=A0A3S4H7I5_KLEPN|nr:putative multidrug efflux system [Klebsiella pneumoniae]